MIKFKVLVFNSNRRTLLRYLPEEREVFTAKTCPLLVSAEFKFVFKTLFPMNHINHLFICLRNAYFFVPL